MGNLVADVRYAVRLLIKKPGFAAVAILTLALGLGVQPLLGRVFHEGDDRPGTPKTTVLSHGLWMRRFHGDPAIVGRSITLSGEPHVVIGVMPPAFDGLPAKKELWRILTMNEPRRRGPFYTWGIARLKKGTTLDTMRANLDAVSPPINRQDPPPGAR